jgi:hypothetical protein
MEARLVYRDAASDQDVPPSSSSYVFNSQALMRQLDTKKRWPVLVTERMRQAYDSKASGRKADSSRKWAKQWKNDARLTDAVLRSLRRDVVQAFHHTKMIPDTEDGDQQTGQLTEPLISVGSAPGIPPNTGKAHRITCDLQTLLTAEDRKSLPPEMRPAESENQTVTIVSNVQTLRLQLALRRLATFLGDEKNENG